VQANASALVGNRLTLLLEDDLAEVAAARVRLAQLLPGNVCVDRFVEAHPQVLEVDDFAAALEVRVCVCVCVLGGGASGLVAASCSVVSSVAHQATFAPAQHCRGHCRPPLLLRHRTPNG
jgi:hypothetical protein